MTTVSAIIPVYNGADRIGSAIESILSQSRRPDELIVIDDGSTDDLDAALASISTDPMPLHTHRQANLGPSAARNRGLESASGSIIAFLDADDRWLPSKLEMQLAALEDNPEADAVFGTTEGVSDADFQPQARAFRGSWSPRHFLQVGAFLFRASCFERVGGFDESMRFGEDFDWLMRARESSLHIATHDDPVLHYHRHEGNMTNDTASRDRGLLRALRQGMRRRRARARS